MGWDIARKYIGGAVGKYVYPVGADHRAAEGPPSRLRTGETVGRRAGGRGRPPPSQRHRFRELISGGAESPSPPGDEEVYRIINGWAEDEERRGIAAYSEEEQRAWEERRVQQYDSDEGFEEDAATDWVNR